MRGAVGGLLSPHPLVTGLPPLLQEDPLAVALVEALDSVLAPVPVTLDNLAAYLSPATAPADWVAYLGRWLGAPAVRGEHDEASARAQVAGWADVQTRSGTASGLADAVRAVLGVDVAVEDSGATVVSLVPGGALPGSDPPRARVRVPRGTDSATAGQVLALAQRSVPPWVVVEVTEGTT